MQPTTSSSGDSKLDRRRRQKNESARRCRERRQEDNVRMANTLKANEERIKQLERQVDDLSSELTSGPRPAWFGDPF